MPYKELHELPPAVQEHLPHHAEEIYLAAYNSAYERYDGDESQAHRVAWAAVEMQYAKNPQTGEWEPYENTDRFGKP